jgi:hypothetical protein
MQGGGGCCGVSANKYSCAHGAQINIGNLTSYLTYGLHVRLFNRKVGPIIEAFPAATWSLFTPAPELGGKISVHFATLVILVLRSAKVQYSRFHVKTHDSTRLKYILIATSCIGI